MALNYYDFFRNSDDDSSDDFDDKEDQSQDHKYDEQFYQDLKNLENLDFDEGVEFGVDFLVNLLFFKFCGLKINRTTIDKQKEKLTIYISVPEKNGDSRILSGVELVNLYKEFFDYFLTGKSKEKMVKGLKPKNPIVHESCKIVFGKFCGVKKFKEFQIAYLVRKETWAKEYYDYEYSNFLRRATETKQMHPIFIEKLKKLNSEFMGDNIDS